MEEAVRPTTAHRLAVRLDWTRASMGDRLAGLVRKAPADLGGGEVTLCHSTFRWISSS
jgi:hypothetical protein